MLIVVILILLVIDLHDGDEEDDSNERNDDASGTAAPIPRLRFTILMKGVNVIVEFKFEVCGEKIIG